MRVLRRSAVDDATAGTRALPATRPHSPLTNPHAAARRPT